MIFDIFSKSLHHQMVLGPPNCSSDFPKARGFQSGGLRRKWVLKNDPPKKICLKHAETFIFFENGYFMNAFYGFLKRGPRVRGLRAAGGGPRKIRSFGGHFSKCISTEGRPTGSPAFGENPRTNLEVQGPFGDEVTYSKLPKS